MAITEICTEATEPEIQLFRLLILNICEVFQHQPAHFQIMNLTFKKPQQYLNLIDDGVERLYNHRTFRP